MLQISAFGVTNAVSNEFISRDTIFRCANEQLQLIPIQPFLTHILGHHDLS